MAKADTDDAPPWPHPRDQFNAFGIEAAERELSAAIAGDRLHHAWLITGPRGVGKATLAYRAARRLLNAQAAGQGLASAADDPVCRRISAQAHADLLVLERPSDGKGGQKAEISVEDARKVGPFFARTAGEGGRRVCIIDAADELTIQGANAILKSVEEPPAGGVFLLIAHAPGRMPATIRSRCRVLRVPAPGIEAAAEAVVTITGADPADAEISAQLAGGRPGAAVRLYVHDGPSLASDVTDVITKADTGASKRLLDRLSARAAAETRGAFFELARSAVREHARTTPAPEPWIAAWDALSALERDLVVLKMDPQLVMTQALDQLISSAVAAESGA